MNESEVIEMRLCEVPHVMLKPDQLYRFSVDMTCVTCVKAAIAAAPDTWGKLIKLKDLGQQ